MSSPSTKRLPVGTAVHEVLSADSATAAVDRFINRDLSLLEFNRRVLDEARDERQPLLERLKLMAIVSSLLDEFFMIRVSGLKEQSADPWFLPDALPTRQLLKEIRGRVNEMSATQVECLKNDILPALEAKGVGIVSFESLSVNERDALTKYFCEQIYPVLTPQAVDPSHPFPYISGGSLNLGLFVKPNLYKSVRKTNKISGDNLFIRLKIPQFIDRLVQVGKSSRFVWIEDLIRSHLKLI